MKLNRENFNKVKTADITTYKYTCNDIDFFLQIDEGESSDSRVISVFKGSISDREDVFVTTDSLEAWNKFEEYLTE